MRKHTLSHALYRKWRKAYDGQGMQGLQPLYKTVDPAVRQLEVENQRLKNIIAKQALEIEFKDELLKKTVERPASQRMRQQFRCQNQDQ